MDHNCHDGEPVLLARRGVILPIQRIKNQASRAIMQGKQETHMPSTYETGYANICDHYKLSHYLTKSYCKQCIAHRMLADPLHFQFTGVVCVYIYTYIIFMEINSLSVPTRQRLALGYYIFEKYRPSLVMYRGCFNYFNFVF